MIHALYCNAINRETRPTAFFQEIPRQRQCYLPALLSGENPGVLLESPSTDMDVFSSLVKIYYKKCFSYIYWYMYLYLSLSICPPVRVRTWKKSFSHQTHLHACPLFCIESNIKPHFNLQSSKPVKIKKLTYKPIH